MKNTGRLKWAMVLALCANTLVFAAFTATNNDSKQWMGVRYGAITHSMGQTVDQGYSTEHAVAPSSYWVKYDDPNTDPWNSYYCDLVSPHVWWYEP